MHNHKGKPAFFYLRENEMKIEEKTQQIDSTRSKNSQKPKSFGACGIRTGNFSIDSLTS